MNGSARHRISRRLLIAGALAAPAIYIPRAIFGGNDRESRAAPRSGHLIVVTFSAIGAGGFKFSSGGELSRLGSRSVSVSPIYADSDDVTAVATSLMLGSTPKSHGVRGLGAAPASGAWSLPTAAAAAGYRTIAVTESTLAPIATALNFDEVVHSAEVSSLVPQTLEHLSAHVREPLLLWLHLSISDDPRAAIGPSLVSLLHQMETLRTIDRTTLLVTSLHGVTGPAEEQLVVPLLVQFPGAMGHGARQRTLLALSDVAPGLRLQLGLPGPDELGCKGPTGRGASFVRATAGSMPFEVVRCEGEFGLVVRGPGANGQFPGFRAFLPRESGRDLDRAEIFRLVEPDSGPARFQHPTDDERAYALNKLSRAL